MAFTIVTKPAQLPTERVGAGSYYLLRDNWDDFGFKTSFSLYLPNNAGTLENIGLIKIGIKNQSQGETKLASSFEKLDSNYFSLGQSKEYYQKIANHYYGLAVLEALNDIAYSDEAREAATDEDVMQASLLRTVAIRTVQKDH